MNMLIANIFLYLNDQVTLRWYMGNVSYFIKKGVLKQDALMPYISRYPNHC